MRPNPRRFFIAGLMVALSASSAAYASASQPTSESRQPAPVGRLYADAGQDADDSGRNVRDQSGKTLTPMDQSNEASDLEMTQRIRKGITSNDATSMQARNVKIITQKGVVTLRGPVKTTGEKQAIADLAKSAGAIRVDNQIEIDRGIPSGEKE